MNKLSYSQEDYLEEIYKQVLKNGNAKVTEISTALNVKKASVSAALGHLAEKKLINYEPYTPITLTQTGEEIAHQILEKHQSMAAFFAEILNISQEDASRHACKMEHFLSDELYKRFLQLYAFIKAYSLKNKNFRDELKKFLV